MDTAQLTAVTTTLKAEEAKLQEQLTEHQQAAKDIQSNLDRLRTAIKALDTNHTTRKQRGPNTKPTVTQGQVSKAVTDALGNGRVLTKADIKERLEQAATKAGKSRVGLVLRLDQALKDGSIQESGGKYRLASSSKQ